MLVCAYIVLKDYTKATDAMKNRIQHWFKEVAAPYKYPRVIYFVDKLPKTETGKIPQSEKKQGTIRRYLSTNDGEIQTGNIIEYGLNDQPEPIPHQPHQLLSKHI